MISFSQTGGTSGITQITISATSTQELADVVNYYTLGNESTSLDMPVVQKAYVPVQKYITMSPSAITWSSSNNTGSITINSNDSWVVVSDGWIQVSRMYESDISERYNSVSGNGNTIIGISCFENIGDARSGGITAYCQSNSAISATTTVSQAGGYVKPYITLGTYSMQVSGGSVTTAVTVQSNVSWTATTDSNWVTLNTLTGSGNGNVSFTVSANTSSIERRATITVFNGEINAVLVLTQAASVSRPYIILSPNSFSVPYEGSTGNTISVSANCDYDIEADVNWITVNAVSGSGNGSVYFSTSAMTGSSIGNIVFSNSAVTEYATVETAFIPYLSASTNNISSFSTGGTFEVSVYSNVNWSVSVDTGEETIGTPWLSATPVGGSNDGTVIISVESGSTAKSGTVTLYNFNYGLSYAISVVRNKDIYYPNYIFFLPNERIPTQYPQYIVRTTSGYGANFIAMESYNISIPYGSWGYMMGLHFDGSVTTIPSSAFSGMSRLLLVRIPETVKNINSYAFANSRLNGSIIYNQDTQTFSGNTDFVIIPDSVETIGDYAFSGVTSMTINLGSSVRTIGVGAFADCVYLNNHDQLVIPNSVETIGASAFTRCSYVDSVSLGESLNSIGEYAFYLASSLNEIYSYNQIAPSIGNNTFKFVNSGGTLHYPSGSDYSSWVSALPSGWTAVDDITPTGDYLTVSPTGFTVDATGSTGNQIAITSNVNYNISSNVNWITLSDSTGSGNKTISFDTSATTETVETNGVITVSSSTKSKTVSITRQAYIPPQPPQPQIPNNEIHYTTTGGTTLAPYTTTGWGATITGNTYSDGQGILAFNGNVTKLPYNAYSNKKELQTIEIPNSVTVISGQSFIYCSKLEEVTIGSGVTSILNYAFYSCSSLATIYAHPTTAPTLGTGVFSVASSGTLHYPSGSDYSSWISTLPSGWTAVADL